jgi:hypothetical protein
MTEIAKSGQGWGSTKAKMTHNLAMPGIQEFKMGDYAAKKKRFGARLGKGISSLKKFGERFGKKSDLGQSLIGGRRRRRRKTNKKKRTKRRTKKARRTRRTRRR